MKTILVTGGTGFIGVPLVKKLNELGHKIKLLVRETSDISPFEGLNNIDYVTGDVRDIESLSKAIEGVDLIYHLAAYTRMWAKDDSIFEEINVQGAENVAKLALERDKKLIYVSSFIALGATPEEPVDESFESEEGQLLDYATTKFEAKKMIKEYVKKGLNVTIFYPGIVYGPRDFNIFGQIIHDITEGSFMGVPGKADKVGSFVYVNDVANGLASVINKDDLKGEEFILAGENVIFNDWINLIAELAGKKKPRHFPMSMGLMYARMCELKTKLTKKMPYINRPTVKMMDYNWSYSSEKAINQLGYKITPLKVGLKKTIEWYEEYIENEKK
ncbi:MAG: NAD-dependent epimerase/dehydratase family protein [Promethearchaeota archaeon]|nr:MAG: NAD-dependent epimerase/dehydratase family protein [Candidatus Lokiarchaeota archaeon]